jgi:hypothetical protein
MGRAVGDLGITDTATGLDPTVNSIGRQEIVRIEKMQVVAFGQPDSVVSGVRHATILLAHEADGPPVRLHGLFDSVRGSVVNDDYLDGPIRLCQSTLDGLAHEPGSVVHGGHDADEWAALDGIRLSERQDPPGVKSPPSKGGFVKLPGLAQQPIELPPVPESSRLPAGTSNQVG